MEAAVGIYDLLTALELARRQLREHRLYQSLVSIESIRLFMQYHVFAVWDFMSLIKLLQCRMTRIGVPWVPEGDPTARRFINEIVMEEESDNLGELGHLSHFELYRAAMTQVGADCVHIDRFVDLVKQGHGIETALDEARVPWAVREFVVHTFNTIHTGELHIVASAFTFGREEPIPEMFRSLMATLEQRFPGKLTLFGLYLDRHVSLDENHHAPMAVRMLANLCGNDRQRWQEARQAALDALVARLSLWNAIAAEVALMRIGGSVCVGL